MRTFSKRIAIPVLAAIVCGALAGVYLGTHFEQGAAHQAASFGYAGRQDDVFRNYDFIETTEQWNKVDWAVTMLYWNNAEIDKVKQTFKNAGYNGWGNPMWSRLTDNSVDWLWDTDRGVKINSCYNIHQRLYADGDDRMYNIDWGYFIIATTHYDVNDNTICGGQKQFGWSESAEEGFAQIARDAGLPVAEDWVYMGNNEPNRLDTSGGEYHYWSNNAYATRVYYP